MSLLSSVNDVSPGKSFFVENDGTASEPILVGNPVQLCTGGPIAASSGVNNAINRITATGSDDSTAVLYLGTPEQPNALVLGPQLASPDIAEGELTAQITMNANASITAGQFSQFVCANGGQLYLESGSEVDVQPGAQVKFNNAGAPRGTFRAVVALPNPFNDGVTTTLTNPVGIVEGVYAIMVDGAVGDGQANRQISTVAYWESPLGWRGGACIEQNNFAMAPTDDRQSITLTNSTGGALTALSVSFIQLVGAA